MEHGGIDGSGVKEEFADELLADFRLFLCHFVGAVDWFCELDFGAIIWLAPLQWGMARLSWCVVLELVEGCCDIAWH